MLTNMKFLMVVLAFSLLSSGVLFAQQFSDTSVSQPTTGTHPSNQGTTFQTQSSKKNVAVKPISPQPTGVLVDIYKKGAVAISPVAPLNQGNGQQNLAAPLPSNFSIEEGRRLPRDAGGIKLGGWNF